MENDIKSVSIAQWASEGGGAEESWRENPELAGWTRADGARAIETNAGGLVPGDAADDCEGISEGLFVRIWDQRTLSPQRKFLISDGNGEDTILADDLADAIDQAEDWLSEGDWEPGSSWVARASVTEIDADDGDGESGEAEVTIEAEEPDCTADEHDWQSPREIVGGIEENPGVMGHGAGVVTAECCMHCGCGKRTNTAATDHTGQRFIEVSYEPEQYAAAIRGEEECA